MCSKLIIVRHCKTYLNEENREQGITDLPLSEEGIKQAQILALALKNEKVEVIYTSQFKRAIQTAEAINKFHNVPLLKEKILNEMSYGIFEGMTINEIKEKYAELFEEWHKDEFNFKFPEGESLSIIKNRLNQCLPSIASEKKNIMIVAHGEVSRVILGILLNWSNEKIISTKLRNGSVTILETEKNPKLLVFNQ